MIFLLTRITGVDSRQTENITMVVRAENETEARALAAEQCFYEGKQVWLNPAFSVCYEVNIYSPAAVIAQEYLRGSLDQ